MILNTTRAALISLIIAGCATQKLKPIDDVKNPVTISLLKSTIEVNEDKIRNMTFYVPTRTKGQSLNREGSGAFSAIPYLAVEPYIVENNKKYTNRIRLRYVANNWIFLHTVDYYCKDNQKKLQRSFKMGEVDRTVSGYILENVDYSSTDDEFSFLKSCNNLVVRLTGKSTYDEFIMDQNTRDAFLELLTLKKDFTGNNEFKRMISSKAK